ncbi:MAG: hypothetical protein QNK18_01490 [Gammaproteobacteria bacterium]|nr:hypothetical protein [Gammaproteobacteria bacterium]
MKRLPIIFAVLLAAPAFATQTAIPNYEKARKDFFRQRLYPNGGRTLYCDQEIRIHAPLNIHQIYAAN